jgi:DNA-binding NtrC family response regulator
MEVAIMSDYGVLFLDDEVNVLSAIRRSLRKQPYRCFFADTPDDAFEILEREKIDLIISDHLMPAMDGLTFLNKVREAYPNIVRVLLTGHADLQMAIRAINEGEVFRFLTKPWNDIELKFTIKHILEFLGLRRKNQVLMETVRKQQTFIDKIENEHPGIFAVERDEQGAIVLDLDDF